MLTRILKKEFKKNKAINITVFLFILFSAFLISLATSTIYTLVGSIDNFFEKSVTPDFVQSHVGDIDQQELDEFAENNSMVKEHQTMNMISIDGASLYLGNKNESEATSAMDASFAIQNKKFDFILDMNNEPVRTDAGEIAVPIYYMDNRNIEIGDRVWVKTAGFEKELVISDITRDAQMNPSLINSKRFIINEKDFSEIKEHIASNESLIEFLLEDSNKISEFTNQYADAGLPSGGFTIDRTILKLFNALSDVLVAAIVIFISLLLISIALLCLRFTLLSTIEEEYREIGVMKGIGMSLKDIRRLYTVKYMIISLAACLSGYVLSLFLSDILTGSITLYMGENYVTAFDYIIPIVGASLIFCLVMLSCRIIMRKFKKISTVEAIRSGHSADNGKSHTRMRLSKTKVGNMNFFLGIRDVIIRFKSYILLIIVFVICMTIMIIPMNFMTTINSPDFLTYMGAAKCEIRVDMQKTDDIEKRYGQMINDLKNDDDIEKFGTFVVCNYKILNEDGLYENISMESGDFDKFPINYVSGNAPADDFQISLSYAKSTDLGKTSGDTVTMIYKGEKRKMKISGIYQDITNGGKTAKVVLPYDNNSVMRYTACVDFKSYVDSDQKIASYTEIMAPAKVTDAQAYLSQTMGGLIDRLSGITLLASAIALFITLLITSLFFKMVITKDAPNIAILNSLGYSLKDIRSQYITKAMCAGFIGIISGIVIIMTLGSAMVDFCGNFVGIASFQFITNPLLIYILAPILLMTTIFITMVFTTKNIGKNFSIRDVIE